MAPFKWRRYVLDSGSLVLVPNSPIPGLPPYLIANTLRRENKINLLYVPIISRDVRKPLFEIFQKVPQFSAYTLTEELETYNFGNT